jgi:hypothetical protein
VEYDASQKAALKRSAFVGPDGHPVVSYEDFKPYFEDPRRAYEEVAPIFRALRKQHRESGEMRAIKAYETPAGLAKSLFGQNAKTLKQDPNAKVGVTKLFRGKKGTIVTTGLSILPAQTYWGQVGAGLSMSIPTTCMGSTPECRAACLVYSGHNESDPYNAKVKRARMEAMYTHPAAFIGLMAHEIERRNTLGRAKDVFTFFRFNVFSDLPWEVMCPDLFALFPDVMTYDYTKVPRRITPSNYDLTFSFSGANTSSCKGELANGRRVAVVFLSHPQKEARMGDVEALAAKQSKMFWPLPERFWGHKVVNGDYSDARPCDPANAVDPNPCVVGLHYKISKGLEDRIDQEIGRFVVETAKPVDTRQEGLQRFREWHLKKNGLGHLARNPRAGLPTIITQVHEIDGYLCVAGTPVHEGANDWHDEG